MTPKTSPKKRVAAKAAVLAAPRAKRAIADGGDARFRARVLDALRVANSVNERASSGDEGPG